jgi:hypothetical protein
VVAEGIENAYKALKSYFGKGDLLMNLELSDKEMGILKHALEDYLSNLREEIVKTEAHTWKRNLHDEENVIKNILEKLS